MAATRVAVLGASGLAESLVLEGLRGRDVEAVAISRSLGVDVGDLEALSRALAGADVVVDALDHQTLSARAAVRFFESAASQVVAAVEGSQPRVVCLSIVNAANPRVHRWLGYYRGKAAQEDVYRRSGLPLSMVRTTQWFELPEALLRQTRVGGTAFVPGILSRPLAVAEAAEHLVEQALAPEAAEVTEICGPEQVDLARLAQQVNAQDHLVPRVVRIPLGMTALGSGDLIPRSPTVITTTTPQQWLARRTPRPPSSAPL